MRIVGDDSVEGGKQHWRVSRAVPGEESRQSCDGVYRPAFLQFLLDLPEAADLVDGAIKAALDAGWRTKDIAAPGERAATTHELGEEIVRLIRTPVAAVSSGQMREDASG